ncbi:unnamed protein product, partial [Mesorhabditis spiculigera]
MQLECSGDFWEIQNIFDLELTTEKCKVHHIWSVLKKHREAAREDPIKRYLFFLDEPPMFRCSEETDCPRAGYPTDVPEELQQQYHPCISPEKLAFLKAYSAMNRAIRYYLMLDYPSSRNRPLIFLLDGLLKEVTDGKLDDIAFNCLTATTTREHRRKSVVNAKKFKNRPGDVVPGYLIQAPTDNYTTLWELRLGTTLVHEDLDLDLTG